jgi:hypothetical protein
MKLVCCLAVVYMSASVVLALLDWLTERQPADTFLPLVVPFTLALASVLIGRELGLIKLPDP